MARVTNELRDHIAKWMNGWRDYDIVNLLTVLGVWLFSRFI